MSRGVRDLRDLICVSRLTFNDSDEEGVYSDCDVSLKKEISSLSLSDNSHSDSAHESFTLNTVTSPDSGFITESPGLITLKPTSVSQSDYGLSKQISTQHGDKKNTKLQKKKRKKAGSSLATHDLPKPAPLPPVQSFSKSSIKHTVRKGKSTEAQCSEQVKKKVRSNFDDILTYMDATIVASWLKRSNDAIQELTKYCNTRDNFVRFAQFWLSEFPDLQKKDIFSMEFDILLNEVALAFGAGRDSEQVTRRDILDLIGAVFKEYPVKLIGKLGPYIFLDYLDILTSERHDQYKKLLSDVRCSTLNRQYAQWLLATRCFALVNVWSSVINFYRNLTGQKAMPSKIAGNVSPKGTYLKRMTDAMQLGYIDVVTYLIESGHIKSTYSDAHGKSLLFTAVMSKQPAIVKYLLSLTNPSLDVNQTADTGNTPLHAAANIGDLQIVEMLCKCDKLNVNCVNTQCESATPLHLAVMHGHTQIVECLLKHGADPLLKMGETTALELARDLDHSEIIALLETKL